MKIINVKILGDNFRSLAANKLYKFNYHFREDRLSTKVFAGLNGSGKSNFLELFSEIFYFLEICHLNTVPDTEKSTKAFGFEIEYLLPKTRDDIAKIFALNFDEAVQEYIKNNLPLTKYSRKQFEKAYYREITELRNAEIDKVAFDFLKENYAHIKISKQLGELPEYCFLSWGEIIFPKEVVHQTSKLLPKKVIAYTSGQNELLSNPYYKLKYHYFKAYENKKMIDQPLVDNHRLFFLNYSTNFSIFVANILLADTKKIGIIREVLQINDLQAFRITINTDQLYKRTIPVNDQLAYNLERLKLCATSWIEKKVGEHNLLILDYLINDEAKLAFSYHFTTAFNLFKLFYDLEYLIYT